MNFLTVWPYAIATGRGIYDTRPPVIIEGQLADWSPRDDRYADWTDEDWDDAREYYGQWVGSDQ